MISQNRLRNSCAGASVDGTGNIVLGTRRPRLTVGALAEQNHVHNRIESERLPAHESLLDNRRAITAGESRANNRVCFPTVPPPPPAHPPARDCRSLETLPTARRTSQEENAESETSHTAGKHLQGSSLPTFVKAILHITDEAARPSVRLAFVDEDNGSDIIQPSLHTNTIPLLPNQKGYTVVAAACSRCVGDGRARAGSGGEYRCVHFC